MNTSDYSLRLQQQIAQYAKDDDQNIHFQDSSISEWYKDKFTRRASQQVLGVSSHVNFYAHYLGKSVTTSKCMDVLSLGSGDASLEILIAKQMQTAGIPFRFRLLELSPALLEKSEQRLHEAKLQHLFTLEQVDLNEWKANSQYAAIMAHHSLHHIQNLESLFDAVAQGLLGYFVTMDMIGRNGHMRWPETLEIIKLLWRVIPSDKRQHVGLDGFEKDFLNWDCSREGFEGIRSQDILPELIKRFGFEVFYAFGGLIDPFIGRGFRRHYDARCEKDVAIIELIGYLNELLLDLGHIKPTQMAAAMTLDKNQIPRIYGKRTPDFCVRWP